jgi:hypothetical protein
LRFGQLLQDPIKEGTKNQGSQTLARLGENGVKFLSVQKTMKKELLSHGRYHTEALL